MIVTSYNQVPKVAGIYRITSPTQKVYIGQATNLYKRIKAYLLHNSDGLKKQPKVYNSIVKHGISSHSVDIIETCLLENLNEREQYYKQVFVNGSGWNQALFCRINDTGGGERSPELREKMGKSRIGKKLSAETIAKRSESRLGQKQSQTTIEKKRKKQQKRVIQYSKCMQVIATYESIKKAVEITKIHPSCCLAGICHTAGGFIWKYDNSID